MYHVHVHCIYNHVHVHSSRPCMNIHVYMYMAVPVHWLVQSLSVQRSASCWLHQSFPCSEPSRWNQFARYHSQFVPRHFVMTLTTGVAFLQTTWPHPHPHPHPLLQPPQNSAVLLRSVSSTCGSSSSSSTGGCAWREGRPQLEVSGTCWGSLGQ